MIIGSTLNAFTSNRSGGHTCTHTTEAPREDLCWVVQVPGNIRRAEHFLAFMRRFIAYLKKRMEVQQVESETPPTFLAHLQAQVAIDGALPILPLML